MCLTIDVYFIGRNVDGSLWQDECKAKYGLPVYYRFLRCFELMPLCAVVANDHGRYFCTHGGISPGLTSLDQIAALNRRWVDFTIITVVYLAFPIDVLT